MFCLMLFNSHEKNALTGVLLLNNLAGAFALEKITFYTERVTYQELPKKYRKTQQKGLINKTGVGAALRAAPTPVFASLFPAFCVIFG